MVLDLVEFFLLTLLSVEVLDFSHFLATNLQKFSMFKNLKNNIKNTEETEPFIELEDKVEMKNNVSSSNKDMDYDERGLCLKLFDCIRRKKKYFARTIFLNGKTAPKHQSYPKNVVKNQKYNLITFLPLALYEQFKFFFNLYFLLIALSQFVPILKVGFLFTYVAPLVFVLGVTLTKEAIDDLKRWKRDLDANSQKYQKLTPHGPKTIPSSSIKVGDMIVIHTNQRVPSDCVLLRTTEKTGASFIRTDQLDGETDWKLRRAIGPLQKLNTNEELFEYNGSVYVERPKREIYDFIGNFTSYDEYGNEEEVESLNLENTLWTNTVVASGNVVGLVIYTGGETKSSMNASSPVSKVGKLDLELNTFSKLLFVLMVILSFAMIALNLFRGLWYITFFRFLLLFSSIIPISMRVNLDMGKTLYSYFIMRDKEIAGTIVRNSSIPEELGRISYLFSDKTGTLTQNDMIFKKLHLGTISFTPDTVSDIANHLKLGYSNKDTMITKETRLNRQKVHYLMNALALCHNVTPTVEGDQRVLQASSPDEIALVKFVESVGLILEERTLTTITLHTPIDTYENYEILNIFPFTSESKRMGIIIQNKETDEIIFFAKGADVIMEKLVEPEDWLSEECDNLARSGLRTLVFGMKKLDQDEYENWNEKYKKAKATLQNRAENINEARMKLEKGMQLLGVSGVEDKLQEHVQESIENMRNAGIKVWMLTGDKVETATCIARSTKLVSKYQNIFYLIADSPQEVAEQLDEFSTQYDSCLILDGKTLSICVEHLKEKFLEYAQLAPCVVCCRCAPTQKSLIVNMIKKKTKKRVASIGDGGNDVSMILAADVGIGIVGKEGKHASLAADFSINQFSYCQRLMLWHGRNAYQRSARLSQFVVHRGLIISILQAVFSAIFYFAAIPIYTGWLMVGYSTFYTMVPVFAIVLDNDVNEEVAFKYPELYKELQKGRSLNLKTFLEFFFKAVYQGGIIMILAILLFESSFQRIVSITFTALIITELLMVQIEVHKHFNPFIIIANLISILIYLGSIFLLPSYFDIAFMLTFSFWWRVLIIIAASLVPVYIVKFIERRLFPPSWTKLS